MTPIFDPAEPSDEAIREDATAWLVRLQSGETNAHAAFEDWYAANMRHADIYDDVLANWEKMAVAADTPAGRAHRSGGSRAPWLTAFAVLAAAVVAAICLVPASTWHQFSALGVGRPTAIEFASGTAETRTLQLADGSQVTLDASSRLYVDFTLGERGIHLERGRARFTVAHGDARPFVVLAGKARVIAHGTIFDVGLLGDKVLVSLLEGIVEVRDATPVAGTTAPSSRFLEPGQKLTVATSPIAAVPQSVQPADVRWTKTGMLSFEDVPLEEVVAAVNRFNELPIDLADPALKELRFSGTFDAHDPTAFAEMSADMFGLALAPTDSGAIRLSSATEN